MVPERTKTPIRKGRLGMKHDIHQIEYPITTHCNLRCENCDHLVPHLKKDDIPVEVFKKDVSRAVELLNIPKFGLVGGEPTLHYAFDEVVNYVSAMLPTFIVTNGLTLLKVNPSTLRKLSVIRISVYPELIFDYKGMIFTLGDILKGSKCILDVRHQDYFFPAWVDRYLTDTEAEAVYGNCHNAHSWKCYTLYKGSFYKCGRSHMADEQAKLIGVKHTLLADGVSLSGEDFDARFISYMRREHRLKACSVCNGTHAPSLPHRQVSSES